MFLLLGAIVNVTVAWGGQIPQLWNNWTIMNDEERDRDWNAFAPHSWPTPNEAFGIKFENAAWTCKQIDDSEDVGSAYGMNLAIAGWPCRAMRGIALRERNRHVDLRGWQVFSLLGEVILLPYGVHWPGFAINTIFYAAILWLLFISPGKLRRFIRVRLHRCPACGYRIAKGVGPVCSECGAALPHGFQARH